MTDLLEYIKKMQEMYGEDVITTADKIKRPDPKPIVKEIEAINEFVKRNPKADGGQLVAPSVDGSRPGYQGPKKLNMDFFRHGTPSDDPDRLKKINDYVKEFEKDYGVKPTAKNIRTVLNEQRRVIPFYEAIYGKLPKGKTNKITNVQKDVVKILKDPKIIAKLEAGKFPTITDVTKITNLDSVLAETRLVDVAEKLRDNPKYKIIADAYLDKPGVSTTDEIFGGKKGKRSRIILENRFAKLMGLDKKLPTLRKDILRKIQNIIPELKGLLSVDEIAGITSSMRRGSGPYAIFGQIIGSDFNTEIKGKGIDKDKGILEKQLVKLKKNDPKRIKLQKNYNEKVDLFETSANKDNPAKKVRGLKLSFQPPSKTIKNKKIYNQYKDLFDAHYKKYGYSFEVPADRDSLVDISKKLNNKSFQNIIKNRFKKLINKGGKMGALTGLVTLAGTGFALADEALAADGTEAKSLLPEAALGTAATAGAYKFRKPLIKAAGKTLSALTGPFPIAGMYAIPGFGIDPKSSIDRSILGAELAFAPSLVKQAQKFRRSINNPLLRKIATVGTMGIPKYAIRAARIANPIGVASLIAEGTIKSGIESAKEGQRIDAIQNEEDQQMEYENLIKNLRNYATGGMVGDKSGPAPTGGPMSQGLRSLYNNGRKL